VLGDELFERVARSGIARAFGLDLEPIPAPVQPPAIFDFVGSTISIRIPGDSMTHRKTHIVFIEHEFSDGSDCAFRHDFTNENNTAAQSFGVLSSHVEAKIDFLEILVKWDRNSKQSGVKKQESNQADVRLPIKGIEVRAEGDKVLDESGISAIVQYRQRAPFGGQENAIRYDAIRRGNSELPW